MSSVPTGIAAEEISLILRANRSARWTPRRRIPTSARSCRFSVFSTISCAKRTSVRSISDPVIRCAFSRSGIRCAWVVLIEEEKPLFADKGHHTEAHGEKQDGAGARRGRSGRRDLFLAAGNGRKEW